MRQLWRGVVAFGVFGVVMAVIAPATKVNSQPPENPAAAPHAVPPADQTYIGAKQCSSCHFKQFMSWKKTKHAKEAWDSVPEKYRADPACINCHSTGFGKETGFKDVTSTPNLVGTACEACHGPGSKHAEVCKQYANKKLTPEEDKIARDSIYKVLPQNVCVACHADKGHKEHPKYDK